MFLSMREIEHAHILGTWDGGTKWRNSIHMVLRSLRTEVAYQSDPEMRVVNLEQGHDKFAVISCGQRLIDGRVRGPSCWRGRPRRDRQDDQL